ncbi:MAG: glycosyltransferase [Planctomycetes bacterium]|nr:glycosyltransferase [Planctomycetota bacterium]
MKLLLVNGSTAWGGGEQWFLDAARSLASRGHEVALVCARDGALAPRARDSGVRVEALPRPRERSELTSELVLVNSPRDLRIAQRCAIGGEQARFVLRRGIDRRVVDNLFRRGIWKRLSAILVNSDATGATVRRSLRWFPAERITRIYNPVHFAPRPHEAGPAGLLRLGAIGRLVKQKGFATLLDALARLGATRRFTLELAGDGPLRARLERRARKRGLSSRVKFLGAVADPAAFYARLDALIVPSRYEGFGYVAVEAALAGLPVIASDASSLREIVIDGETGWLVPARKARPLSEAIVQLAADPADARRRGERARLSAAERFGPGPLLDQLEAFLSRAASLPPVGS